MTTVEIEPGLGEDIVLPASTLQLAMVCEFYCYVGRHDYDYVEHLGI